MNKKCDEKGRDLQTQVLKALLDYPNGATANDLGCHLRQYADTIRHACDRLAVRGVLAKRATRPVTYLLNALGQEVAHGRAELPQPQVVPDDNWQPKPWIHPIRARALGLPVAGRSHAAP